MQTTSTTSLAISPITNYIFIKLLEFINVTFNFIIIENRISTERNTELRITECKDKLAKSIKLEGAINFRKNFKWKLRSCFQSQAKCTYQLNMKTSNFPPWRKE